MKTIVKTKRRSQAKKGIDPYKTKVRGFRFPQTEIRIKEILSRASNAECLSMVGETHLRTLTA